MDALVGVGEFDAAIAALEWTVERARPTDDTVTVAVFETEDHERKRAATIERVREYLSEVNIPTSVRPLAGNPGPALVTFAETGAFEQIVLANTDRTPMGKVRVTELIECVLLNSQVTVTLVR